MRKSVQMRIILAILLCFFALAPANAQKHASKQARKEVAWKTYTDTANKVSIKYPATWERKPVENTVFFFWAPYLHNGQKFRENVNLSMGDAQDLYLVEYLMDARKKMPQELEEFKEIKSQYDKINGRDCVRMIYQFRHGGVTFKNVLFIFLNNGKAYSLNFSALPETFDQFHSTFEEIAKTFKIK